MSQEREMLLMAPTGRAAQVMGSKTDLPPTTIHKAIYSFHELDTIETTDEEGEETFQFIYQLRSDADIVSQVFIVDEGSMLSDHEVESEFFKFGSGRVLFDLLRFGKIGQSNVRTQLIVVGDPAQLPPVGMASSPALDEVYLMEEFKLTVSSAELQEVVRQGGESGVLELATQVRHCITANRFTHFAITDNGADIQTIAWNDFLSAYKKANARKVVICYKNKTAKDLSERIRAERFGSTARLLEKGGIRRMFDRPTAMTKRFEMHVTTLNEGLWSHPPHTHRAAEFLLMVDKSSQESIDGKLFPATVGDLIFLESEVPHALQNTSKGSCTYVAFQFE